MPTAQESPLQPARPDDVEDLSRRWSPAFPSRSAMQRARELKESMTYGTLADCWIASDGGEAVGAPRTLAR